MEDGRSIFKILTGKPTRKTPLESPRSGYENIIRIIVIYTLGGIH